MQQQAPAASPHPSSHASVHVTYPAASNKHALRRYPALQPHGRVTTATAASASMQQLGGARLLEHAHPERAGSTSGSSRRGTRRDLQGQRSGGRGTGTSAARAKVGSAGVPGRSLWPSLPTCRMCCLAAAGSTGPSGSTGPTAPDGSTGALTGNGPSATNTAPVPSGASAPRPHDPSQPYLSPALMEIELLSTAGPGPQPPPAGRTLPSSLLPGGALSGPVAGPSPDTLDRWCLAYAEMCREARALGIPADAIPQLPPGCRDVHKIRSARDQLQGMIDSFLSSGL